MPELKPDADDRGLRQVHEGREGLLQEVPLQEGLEGLLKHLVIVNPKAGRGRGDEVGSRIERLYREADLACEFRRTGGPGDATRFAREGARLFGAIVAIGGDGTFHEVVNGLAEAAIEAGGPERVAAAASVPIGTGNDFVKSLGIAPEPEAGFAAARAGRRRRVDLGRFRTGPDEKARWFTNQIQIGYGAAVVHDMASPRSLSRRYLPGHLAYVGAGFARLGYATREIVVRHDGGEERGRFFEVHIANGRYCGGGISFATRAEIDDGLLELVTIGPLRFHRRVGTMLKVRAARPIEGDGIARTATVRVEVRDSAPFPISVDGEALHVPSGILEAEVVPGAIDVIGA